jgi:hypothetical protein
MTHRKPSAVLGKWRIIKADLWAADYLDSVEAAYIRFDANGHGEMVFGALQAALDCQTSPTTVFFTFEGSDEMDPLSGTGSAEVIDDGTLEVEISFHLGDDAEFTARRW